MEPAALSTEIVGRIEKLFASGHKVSLYTTGCNSNLLAWLTLVPGASKCVVELRNPYAVGATTDLLGCKPAKSVSSEVSKGFASSAYINTQRYLLHELGWKLGSFNANVIGIGVTGALRSNYERKGAHHAYITFMNKQHTVTYYVTLSKDKRTREQEDWFLSVKTLDLLFLYIQGRHPDLESINAGCSEGDNISFVESIVTLDLMTQRLESDAGVSNIIFLPNGQWLVNTELDGFAMFPGAFNPVHKGHLELAKQMADRVGIDKDTVIYEMSINNVDKELIESEIYLARVKDLNEHGCIAMITKKPLFFEKNSLMKNGFFVMGADTIVRLISKKYYDGSYEKMIGKLAAFALRGNKIVLAPRKDPKTGEFLTMKGIEIPEIIKEIILELEEFRVDISSTELRKSGK